MIQMQVSQSSPLHANGASQVCSRDMRDGLRGCSGRNGHGDITICSVHITIKPNNESSSCTLQLLHWLPTDEPANLGNPTIADTLHHLHTVFFRLGELV